MNTVDLTVDLLAQLKVVHDEMHELVEKAVYEGTTRKDEVKAMSLVMRHEELRVMLKLSVADEEMSPDVG